MSLILDYGKMEWPTIVTTHRKTYAIECPECNGDGKKNMGTHGLTRDCKACRGTGVQNVVEERISTPIPSVKIGDR